MFARKGQGACPGDFGSPLTSNRRLIGVASWAWPCARGLPDGYVRLSVFLKWIQQVSGAIAV